MGLIADAATTANIATNWAVVRKFCQGSHRQAMAGPVYVNETPPTQFFNLPLILAYGVLDETLVELEATGIIPACRGRPSLGQRMENSKTVLAWVNFADVKAGKDKRNKMAHEGQLLDRADCLHYIDAIETELKAWPIL